jgi:hypothetical protein
LLYCPSCRKNIYDSTELYCPDCGTRLVAQPVSATAPNPPGSTASTSSISSQLAKLTPRAKLVLGVIVLIIIVVGVAAALGGSHSPQPSSPNPNGNGGNGGGKCCFAVRIADGGGCFDLYVSIDGTTVSSPSGKYCSSGTNQVSGPQCMSEVTVSVYPLDAQSLQVDLLLNNQVVRSSGGGSLVYSCA